MILKDNSYLGEQMIEKVVLFVGRRLSDLLRDKKENQGMLSDEAHQEAVRKAFASVKIEETANGSVWQR